MSKTCSKCNQIKEFTEFGKLSAASDGYRGTCKSCRSIHDTNGNKERCARHYLNNKLVYSQNSKIYREKNHAEILSKKRIYYRNNVEKSLQQTKAWTKNNPEKRKSIASNYKKRRNFIVNANTAKRYASKTKSTPKWLTKEQLSEIKCIYQEVARLSQFVGIKYEVDHIIPLRSEFVCGLHVPWNLRIITKSENIIKSNKALGDISCLKK